jgi:sec-independent protein translocase protein TatA
MGEFKRGRQELEDEIKRGVEAGDDDANATDAAPETETDPEAEDAERLGETEVVS